MGPYQIIKDKTVKNKTRSLKAAVQVVRRFLTSHGFDAEDVSPDDVADCIEHGGIWEYENSDEGHESHEEVNCSIRPTDAA